MQVSSVFVAVVFVFALHASQLLIAETPRAPLRLEWNDRFLVVSGRFPGGSVTTHYLEAYCRPGSTDRDWNETVIPHRSRLVGATEDGRRVELEDRLEDGVVVHHLIESKNDEVAFTVTANNPTNEESQVHWAQPCVRLDKFTGADPSQSRQVYPPYISRCFLMVAGKLTRLPTEPWATKARYVPGQVYVPENVPRIDVNPRPLSSLVPSSGLTGCYSADEKMIFAVAWEPYQEIFQGVITCMHADFRIGGLMPGETKVIRGRMYIVPADEERLLQRFRRDFELEPSSQRKKGLD